MRISPVPVSFLLVALATAANAEQTFTARLASHAFLPALTMVAPPPDAPREAWMPGKFTGKERNETPMSVMGDVGPSYGSHPTGISLPFLGQPVQGMSGFATNRAPDGSIFTLTDNGFGAKANSADALLFFHRLVPDFETGKVARRETVFLRDPDRKVPFRIAHEGTESRYLTGADFDPESIQYLNDEIWIGEEFGPYIFRATADGRVIEVFQTLLDGEVLKGPDTPGTVVPAAAGKDFRVQRSGGYEGMGLQPGTELLWAMLEKPVLREDGEVEGNFLRVMTFDPGKGAWTGDSFRFQLGEGATAIGDFNFIDETRALVIERDNGEGHPSLECQTEDKTSCYPSPAKVKQVVLVDTSRIDDEGAIHRIGHIDLMDIEDPDGKAILKTTPGRDLSGKFSFPFFTIENVMRVDDTHIMVATTTTCPSRADARSARLPTTSSYCSRSRTSWGRGDRSLAACSGRGPPGPAQPSSSAERAPAGTSSFEVA